MKQVYISILIVIAAFMSAAVLNAQQQRMWATLESGTAIASKKQPFWNVTNNFGLITPTSNSGWLRLKTGRNSDSAKRKPDYEYVVDVLGRTAAANDMTVHQLYAGIRYKSFQFNGGLKEEHIGSQDSLLSCGGAIWSGNAPPMPKVTFQTNGFVEVPFSKGWVRYNGGIAHGWFGNDGNIKDAMLHEKYLYMRFKITEKIYFTAGLQHFVQWGGHSQQFGQLPSKPKDFVRVFLASDNDNTADTLNPNIPKNESHNRYGNHLGTKDFSLEATLFSSVKLKAYWQNFIEDITGLGYRNAMDGLWGIKLINRQISLLYEFEHTYTYKIPQKDIRLAFDNYFTNGIYTSGWTYRDYVIGTPLITSPALLGKHAISTVLPNNRIIAHHIGVDCQRNWGSVIFQYLYSENYGNAYTLSTHPLVQHSAMLSFDIEKTRVKNVGMQLNIGMDRGKLFKNTEGISVQIRYRII